MGQLAVAVGQNRRGDVRPRQSLQALHGAPQVRRAQVGVPRRHLDVGVSEDLTHPADSLAVRDRREPSGRSAHASRAFRVHRLLIDPPLREPYPGEPKELGLEPAGTATDLLQRSASRWPPVTATRERVALAPPTLSSPSEQ